MPAHLRLTAAVSSFPSAPPSEHAIRVVLADDHAGVRRNLRALLDSEDGLEVRAESSDLSTTMRLACAHRPHVLVLDLGIPGQAGIQTIRELRKLVPDTQIVVLTMDDSPVFARHALGAGAIAFVLKEMADSDLPAAIRGAANGEAYVSPRISARIASLGSRQAEGELTSRETES